MLKSYDKVLDNAAWIKQATIYKETTVTTKAKIFYFHGGGLLYGSRRMTNRGKVSENLFGIRQVTEGTDRHAESHISGTICSRSAAGARG